MKQFKSYTNWIIGAAFIAGVLSSCEKDGNPNNLPEVSPAEYAGKIDGYSSSDEIFPKNLVAYWSFDGTKSEKLSNTAPTSSLNDALVEGGVKGQALSLKAGYVYFGSQFEKFKTEAFKSFTISQWVKIVNNGTKRTMIFQLARPGIFHGNINFALNTNAFPESDVNNLKIQPTFTTVGGGTQDNLNNQNGTFPYTTPKIGMDQWVHLLITYEAKTGVFNIWSNGIKAGAYPNRGTGASSFKSWEPSEVIIGANYNGIPGKQVSTDVSFAPMTGSIDEIRVYNIALPDAHIKSLYNLGKASK